MYKKINHLRESLGKNNWKEKRKTYTQVYPQGNFRPSAKKSK